MEKSNEIVKHLIQYFQIVIKQINSYTTSNSSEVYQLTTKQNETYILKIPYNETKYKREKKALYLLNDVAPVPEIINFYDGDEIIPPALLLSYLDGTALKGPISKEVSYQMGRILAKIHQVSLNQYGSILTEDHTITSFIEHLNHLTLKSYEHCVKVLDHRTLKRCMKLLENTQKQIIIPDKPSLIHSDFRMGNILEKENQIIGVIDFETANGGIPIADFAIIKREIWDNYKGTQESFLEGYQTIKKLQHLDESIFYFELFDTFTKIGWFIKRNKTHDPLYIQYTKRLIYLLKDSY